MTTATLAKPAADATPGHIAVFETSAQWKEGLRTDVTARQFSIPVDEPQDLGGADTAPNPMELLLAGLNGCLAVVIKVVAAEYGANVTSINFASQANLDARGFLGTAKVQPYFQAVRTRIEIGTDVPEERFDAFTAEVHGRCPAGTLIEAASGVDFKIEWVRI